MTAPDRGVRASGPATVRRATTADAPAIARVHVDSAREAEGGLVPERVLRSMAVDRRAGMWRRILDTPEHPVRVVVGEAGGALVGVAAVSGTPGADGAGELHALYVDPRAQGRGHGSLLLDAAEQVLAEMGCREAVLWVLDRNEPATGFYRTRGWQDDDAERTEEVPGGAVRERRLRKRLVP